MLHVVAADEHEAAPSVDRCRVDHCEAGLASARRGIAEPLTAEPAHQPRGQPDQAEHHDDGDREAKTVSLAEYVEHHSSLRPRGVASPSESSEWLTPTAI